MRYIGRIITSSKIENLSDFIEVTKDSSSIKNNEAKIPTLIIGHKNAESICGGEVKMLNKKIGNNLYWTFSKRERRVEYEPDLNNFLVTVSDFLMKFCQYEYIDLITINEEKRNELSEVISSSKRKVIYTTDSMYYIYYPTNNKTYGISKEVLKFLNYSDEKMMERFNNPSVTIISDSDFSETKIAKSKFVLPLLYYLATF
jgi:hypothetical protein